MSVLFLLGCLNVHIDFRHNKKFRLTGSAFLFGCLAFLYIVLGMVYVTIIQKSNLALNLLPVSFTFP